MFGGVQYKLVLLNKQRIIPSVGEFAAFARFSFNFPFCFSLSFFLSLNFALPRDEPDEDELEDELLLDEDVDEELDETLEELADEEDDGERARDGMFCFVSGELGAGTAASASNASILFELWVCARREM